MDKENRHAVVFERVQRGILVKAVSRRLLGAGARELDDGGGRQVIILPDHARENVRRGGIGAVGNHGRYGLLNLRQAQRHEHRGPAHGGAVQDDLHVLAEARPGPAHPFQGVIAVENAEAHIVPFALPVGAQIQQQHLIALLVEKFRVTCVIDGVACKTVVENGELAHGPLRGEKQSVKPQPVPGAQRHMLPCLPLHPLAHRRHADLVLLHLCPVGKLVNDFRIGSPGARQRLVEEDQRSNHRRNPGADPGRTQGAAGQKQVLQVFIHSIILSSADAEKRPGSSMGLFTTAQSASVYS